MRHMLGLILALWMVDRAWGGNFSTGATAVKFGVVEVLLQGDDKVANPFDTTVHVTFTPPSGAKQSKQVFAFYDGAGTWKARVYAHELGAWQWSSQCSADAKLNRQSGNFVVDDSNLRGRLLVHPKNSRQWITENGRWFLNLNDTAYFLLCARDGNGVPVTDETVQRYMKDNVERGITSIRCFLSSREKGFQESSEQWREWFFQDGDFERLKLEKLQTADRRLRYLLDEFPDVAVQLILFPLEAYARDDRFWTALSNSQRERLLRNIVARFAAYPQIFWLVTNDAHYGPKYPNSNAMVRQVGEYLIKHDPWRHPRSTGHARRLPFVFADEAWVDYVHIEHAHDLGAEQYAQYHHVGKPVFLGEDRYEQDRGKTMDPQHMRYWQRRLFWAWLLSGGSTNYGGRWWAVHPYSATGQLESIYQSRPTITFRAPLKGLDSVRHIRDFFVERTIDLGEFEPDHLLVKDADGRSGAQSPRLMRRSGDEFIAYHPHAGADDQAAQVRLGSTARLHIDLSTAKGEFAVEWYRAEDGRSQFGSDVSAGHSIELTAPWPDSDVVVRLKRK